MTAGEIILNDDRAETITRARAEAIYRRHGIKAEELVADLGDRNQYVLADVLVCLGY